jgi:macrolide transport system ATP-binding/permease protein
MIAPLRSLWRALSRRRDFEHAMDEEMRFHLDARAADLVRGGLTPEEAARRARLEFGGREGHKEDCRQARGLRLFDELGADLRYAWRSLKRNPGASAVAVVILGLAIGVNVALFTFIDAYVLSPLPIAAADRYVDLMEIDARGKRSRRFIREEIVSLEAAAAPAFEGLYASTFFELPMLEPTKQIVHGQAVSSSYFPLLGARLARGRAFRPEEDHLANGEAVVVLSDVGWKRLLGGDEAVLGRKIRLGRAWLTVVGVTSPGFRGVETILPDLWIPLSVHGALAGRPDEPSRYRLAGLLRPGVTPEAASGLGSGVVAGFHRPADPGRTRRLLVEGRPSLLDAGERAALSVVGGLVLSAFGLVLLIACSNLASLHVALASARHREIATRLALGASRARLVRQLLTESLVLAAIGTLVGGGLAVAGAQAIQARLFSIVTEAGLTMAPLTVHARVPIFAALLGTIAGIAFGLLPALEATSPDLVSGARRDGLALGGRIRSSRLGGLLVTAQVAASLVLLVLASLLLRNVQAASNLDPGYDAARLVDLRFPHPTANTLERLRRDPRVALASAVAHTPLSGTLPRHSMIVGGVTQTLRYNEVDEAYFDTLGLRLGEGRGFRHEEVQDAAPVAVISLATARALWPGASPLGRVVEVAEGGELEPGRYEVIGVAPDVMSGFFLEGRDPSAVYFPARPPRASEILVRPRGETAAFAETLRGLCQEIDGDVLCDPMTLHELVARQRFPFLAASVVASALGAAALAITAIGLYGIVAFAVVQRLREVGLRLALGATPAEVQRLLVGRATRSVLWGLALGLPVSLLLAAGPARFLRGNAFDPVPLLGVPFFLALVAMTAALIPTRRAATTDPMVSLRTD